MFQKWRAYFPPYIQSLLARLLVVTIILTITRIIFYVNNSSSFSQLALSDWFAGVWFDLITICLIFLPYITLSILPVPFRDNRWYKLVQKISFYFPFLAAVSLNLVDTEYFNFTQKRSTADLFALVSAGNDVGQLLTTFIKDFWVLILCFIVLYIGMAWMYRKTEPKRFETKTKPYKRSWKKESLFFLVIVPIVILVGRGGFSLKPVNIIDATLYTEPQNTALILNTPFTIVKSYGKDDLVEKKYMSLKEERKLYDPVRQSAPQNVLPDKTNVMVIMLESFGNEWVGAFNDTTSYTPFLDSLIGESWVFEYGFSNGKKSIEAVPSIVSSLPTLMDNPYISSPYANNAIETLPGILKKHGYSTAFYHGATNGSMRFNSFAKQAGFEKYFGRFEYNNDKHSDKTWGILDEYFNPWTAKQLTKQKAPFFATLFTLSSHHPYYVPPHWKGKLRNGPEPICRSIHYGDVSLKKFFEQAKKEPWYNNTLFVLVADHTPSTSSSFYSKRTQMYRIPIVFFHPQQGKLPKKREKVIFQQIDIMPTVLDLVNINTRYYSFGQSYFSGKRKEAVTYLEGSYYYFEGEYMLVFSGDEPRSLKKFAGKGAYSKSYLPVNSKRGKAMTRQLRAIIQRYNRDLIHNQTHVK
ncbi:MAG TPA: LTA synthase family protein [Fluviicola sp.]|nr:LTA synthase family protein [Fluviicola sp.]